MRIGLYQGVSLVSRMIRFITRSHYSHAAFVFDLPAYHAASRMYQAGERFPKLHFWNLGAVVEAWSGGVHNSVSVSSLHTSGTRVDLFEPVLGLSDAAEEALVKFCAGIVGDPYSYWNVVRFLTRRPGRVDGSWFCSEAVFCGFQVHAGLALLNHKHAWEVPPDWLQMPASLRKVETVYTR